MRVLDNELKNKLIDYEKLLEYGFMKKDELFYIKLRYITMNLK